MTIPRFLWNKQTLYMPKEPSETYVQATDQLGYTDKVKKITKDDLSKITGGATTVESEEYFAHKFATSFLRVEYFVLDPNKDWSKTSIDLYAKLSDGTLTIVDIPSGSGSAGIAFLTTLAKIRSDGFLPTTPLNVKIYIADISVRSMEIYKEVLDNQLSMLKASAIHIDKFHSVEWDAEHAGKTSMFMNEVFDMNDSDSYLVITSAFSRYAKDHHDSIMRSFQHIKERLYNIDARLIFIEPGSNEGANWLRRLLNDALSWGSAEDKQKSELFKWFHPVKEEIMPRGQVQFIYDISEPE